MQLFIQFGIVGIMTYIILIILVLKKIYTYLKNTKKDYLIIGIVFGIIVIMTHSMIDFDMSFFNVFLTYYGGISILNCFSEEKSKSISYKSLFLYGISLLLLLYINIGGLVAYNINTDNISNKEKELKLINLQIALAPYDYSYRKDKVNYLITIKNSNIYELNSEKYKDTCNEIIKQEKFIINKEKLKEQHEFKNLLYNKIDLITEENKEIVLAEVIEFINKNNVFDLEGVKSKLIKKLNEEDYESTIKQIRTTEINY